MEFTIRVVINTHANSICCHKTSKFKTIEEKCLNKVKNHKLALSQILQKIKKIHEINAIGHRVVHGADKFVKPTLINQAVISKLEKYNWGR